MMQLIGFVQGISLSAACGFRTFVPFFLMSLGTASGLLPVPPGFLWLGNPVTILLFGILALLEIMLYFNPWIDNLLDLITSALSIPAGLIIMYNCIPENSGFFLSAIMTLTGVASAVYLQLLTVKTRALSGYFRSGHGDYYVAGAELILSICITILALYFPVAAIFCTALSALLLTSFVRIAASKKSERGKPYLET